MRTLEVTEPKVASGMRESGKQRGRSLALAATTADGSGGDVE